MLGCGLVRASHNAPRATADKRRANDLDTSDSGCSVERATWRPAPGLIFGAGSPHLTAQSKSLFAQGHVDKLTASTGDHVDASGRQLNHAEVIAACTVVVAGRPVKWAAAEVDSSYR
ncbi:hypothetical protein L798_03243 [Zootermopsis nevadensis]|uniref:Uncharacterized protein n=1 Tax=Zootermopsis nevadensis TaxID=136037 RepID=A0A067QIS9_ZOONE|nr:hypothetical protein L798_03243 [Zootermopsis nevadensis]